MVDEACKLIRENAICELSFTKKAVPNNVNHTKTNPATSPGQDNALFKTYLKKTSIPKRDRSAKPNNARIAFNKAFNTFIIVLPAYSINYLSALFRALKTISIIRLPIFGSNSLYKGFTAFMKGFISVTLLTFIPFS